MTTTSHQREHIRLAPRRLHQSTSASAPSSTSHRATRPIPLSRPSTMRSPIDPTQEARTDVRDRRPPQRAVGPQSGATNRSDPWGCTADEGKLSFLRSSKGAKGHIRQRVAPAGNGAPWK
eukprot:CAMPEP_0201602722 /NCGR_PEP_ID=MMETSP0492-20130828/3364_1 /ASSEMBLY_ACC=CAM_ASM_000837 /TAXON_ID=420259 /ORGANISM="Thalassiosira gravida, Strain GMp14c1" /LENGTH=119 /DNA_ID=CAMNT_0048066315 /DNA_START=259 /DNA_END=618 /DNA_ORIENTATION=+